MFRSVFRYWRYALPAALLMVLEVLADLWQPRLMAEIVDQGILGLEGSGGASADIIRSTGLVMLAVTFGGCLCGVLSGACASVFSQCAAHGIRRECFSTVMKFSPREIQEFTAGSLLTRCTQDAAQIQMTLAQAVRGGVRCLMFLGAGSAALLAMSPDFALVMAIAVPLVILETVFVLRRASPLFTRTQESLDRLNTVIRESVEGIRIIKACAGEEREERKFTGASRDLSDLQFRTAVLLCTLHPVMNIVLNLAAAGIIQIGAFQVEAEALAPGAVIAGVTYASQILMSLLMAAMLFQSASRGAASAARISQVLRCQATSRGGNVTSGSRKGEVEFRNVTFSYPGRSAPALEKASFTIGRGQFLAILGSTGSGKSTIARLLLGFHEPDEGQILVEGTDTREFDRTALRTCIAAVLQDCRIFRGTVAANIAAGGNEDKESRRAGPGRQFHQRPARRLPDFPPGRRGRAFRGTAPAHCHRPGVVPAPGYPAPGRLLQRPGQRDRSQGPGGDPEVLPGHDPDHHHPAGRHSPGCRSDPGAGSGPDLRRRHPQGADRLIPGIPGHPQFPGGGKP